MSPVAVWLTYSLITILVIGLTVWNALKRDIWRSLACVGCYAVGVAVALLLTKGLTLPLLKHANAFTKEDISPFVNYLFGESLASHTALAVAKAAFAPVLFFFCFLLVEAVCLTGYTLLSCKVLPKTPRVKGNKVVIKVISCLLNAALCLSFLTNGLAVGVHAGKLAATMQAAPAANEWIQNESLENWQKANKNPLVRAYALPAKPLLEHLARLSSRQSVYSYAEERLTTLNALSLFLSGTPTAAECRAAAATFAADPETDRLAGSLLQDVTASWKQGEVFLGVVPPIVTSSDAIVTALYEAIGQNELASQTLNEFAFFLSLYELFGGNESSTPERGEETGGEKQEETPAPALPKNFYEVFALVDENTALLVEELLTEEILTSFGLEGETAKLFGEIANCAISEVLAIHKDESIPDKQAALKEESDKIDLLMEMAKTDLQTKDLPTVILLVGTSRLISAEVIETVTSVLLSEEKLIESGLEEKDASLAAVMIDSVMEGLISIKRAENLTQEEKQAQVKAEVERVETVLALQENGLRSSDVAMLLETVGLSKLISPEATRTLLSAYASKESFLAQGMGEKQAAFTAKTISLTVEGVLAIREDESLTQEEKEEKIKKEALCIGTLIELIQNGVTSLSDVFTLIACLSSSEVLISALPELTAMLYDMLR